MIYVNNIQKSIHKEFLIGIKWRGCIFFINLAKNPRTKQFKDPQNQKISADIIKEK